MKLPWSKSDSSDKDNQTNQMTSSSTQPSEEKYKNQIKEYFKENVDIVLSDMAVNTTGNKNLDSIVTGELCIEALNFAIDVLKKNGQFVSKIFMGSTFNEIVKYSKATFKETSIFKPPASRKDSKENFLISKNLR